MSKQNKQTLDLMKSIYDFFFMEEFGETISIVHGCETSELQNGDDGIYNQNQLV